ncbi:ribokinase [Sphingomonas bacterium]|uniref:ribokinase n=1 Tax=Sphingomonas bacterium TaxID=1895847 RepID=UPI0015752CEB|nr:ribokinase [Sphingomonas bacterium]
MPTNLDEKLAVIVLGSINEDIVAQVEDLPRRGETVAALRIDRSPGGKGLNQAVAAARFGARVTLRGAVGDDAAGALLRTEMEKAGLDTAGVDIVANTATGQALIYLARNGDNSIVVATGANADYGAARLAATPLPACTVLLTQFESTIDAIEALFSGGGDRPLRILNAAPALLGGRSLLPLADIVILNETELQTFAGSLAPLLDDEMLVAAARRLISRPDQRVMVTLGADGCRSIDAATMESIPAFPVAVVDTVGAGDCFCGVFAAAMAEHMTITDALRYAAAAAALSVGRRGAATAMPYRAEVEAFLRDAGRASSRDA